MKTSLKNSGKRKRKTTTGFNLYGKKFNVPYLTGLTAKILTREGVKFSTSEVEGKMVLKAQKKLQEEKAIPIQVASEFAHRKRCYSGIVLSVIAEVEGKQVEWKFDQNFSKFVLNDSKAAPVVKESVLRVKQD